MNQKMQKLPIKSNNKSIGLENVAHNIYNKMFELNTTLPEIAKMIGIEYQTLRRITEQKDNYNPNFKALQLIADFFKITVSDLLGSPHIGQYVPILDYREAETYVDSDNNPNDLKFQKVFCDRYIHPNAFAVEVNHEYLGSKLLIKYVFKPHDKIALNNRLLLKYENQYNFGIVESIDNKKFKLLNINGGKPVIDFKINEVKVIALAVKQISNDDLT